MLLATDVFSTAMKMHNDGMNMAIHIIDEEIEKAAAKGAFSTKVLFTIDELPNCMDALCVESVLWYLQRSYIERGFKFSIAIRTMTTIKIIVNWGVPNVDDL